MYYSVCTHKYRILIILKLNFLPVFMILSRIQFRMVELNKDLIIKNYDNEPDLDIIDLSFCNINKIDANAFKQFTELEYLFLDRNEIEELEATLFEALSKLQLLSFCDNRIKRITFKGLTKIKDVKSIPKSTDNY